MKAFKQWAGPAFYYGNDPLDRPILEVKRKGWRAALEWLTKEANRLNQSAQGLDICTLTDIINTELEEN